MSKQLRVGVLGATGMVGQRFVALLAQHPWFHITVVAASPSSAGKTYAEAVSGRWAMPTPVPEATAALVVADASDVAAVGGACDFVLGAVDLPDGRRSRSKSLRPRRGAGGVEQLGRTGGRGRADDDPRAQPGADHRAPAAPAQHRRQLHHRRPTAPSRPCRRAPAARLRPRSNCRCTYQAISSSRPSRRGGDGRQRHPVHRRREKSERGAKIGRRRRRSHRRRRARIGARCVQVPVADGHLAAVFVEFAPHGWRAA
ncbi:MAG: hypothetical protein R2939_04080 [Kofleriaceae bacterium]